MTISTRKQQAMHKAHKQHAHHQARVESATIIDRELARLINAPIVEPVEPEPEVQRVQYVHYSFTPEVELRKVRVTYKKSRKLSA